MPRRSRAGLGAELRVGVAGLRGLPGCFRGPGRRPLAQFQARESRRVDPQRHEGAHQNPHAGDPVDVPEPANQSYEGGARAVAFATTTMREFVLRCRIIPRRSPSTRGARRGTAPAKATTKIPPAMPREAPPTNGCTSTTPIAITPAVGQVVLPDPLLLQLRGPGWCAA